MVMLDSANDSIKHLKASLAGAQAELAQTQKSLQLAESGLSSTDKAEVELLRCAKLLSLLALIRYPSRWHIDLVAL